MVRKICKECKTDLTNKAGTVKKSSCPICKSKKSLIYEKNGVCDYCGKKFTYYTTCLTNTKKYHSEECKTKGISKILQKNTKNNLLNFEKKIITDKVFNIIKQEILTNGEEIFLEILKLGKKEMFKEQYTLSSYSDDGSNIYKQHKIKKQY